MQETQSNEFDGLPRLVRTAAPFRITREWLHRFPNWNADALKVLGIDTDQPPKGWLRAVCGRVITHQQRIEFERLARRVDSTGDAPSRSQSGANGAERQRS